MANDTTSPRTEPEQVPDHLVLKEPEDLKYVTEQLASMPRHVHIFLAVWLVVLGALDFVALIRIWPQPESVQQKLEAKLDSLQMKVELSLAPASDTGRVAPTTHAARNFSAPSRAKTSSGENLPTDQRFLLLALLAGILGGVTHGLSSLMDFRGNRRLFRSWALWYFGVPLVGGLTAVISFVVVRTGLFPDANMLSTLNPYGVVAVGALVGLFTDKATTKLGEVLDTLFATGKKREGKLSESPPPPRS